MYAGETGITDTHIQYGSFFVPLLLLLVAALLVIIAGLVFVIRHENSQLRRTREYLVRYITFNIELKKQVPSLEPPYPFDPPEVTPQEFIKVIDNMLKRLLFLSLFALLVLPLAAQEAAPDSAYTFRFVYGKETFFVPYWDNAPTLRRLLCKLDSCYTRLDSGYAYVSVTGYIAPAADEEATPASEPQSVSAPETKEAAGWLLRANLLRWATLTPDFGIEWRINPNWSVLLNGSWTSWSWDNKNRRYALWNISPAIHYYIGAQKRGYAGVLFQTGEFNYKLSETGKQGDYYGGGIVGGYRLPIGKRLMMDFSLGAGYTRAKYDKYAVIDNVRVKRGKENKNYWGVNHAGITLVWQLK